MCEYKQNNINCDTYKTVLNSKTEVLNVNPKMKSHVPCLIISKSDHRTVIPINQKLETTSKTTINQIQDHLKDLNIPEKNNPNLNDLQNFINETIDPYESKEYFGKTFKSLFPYTSPNHLNEQNTNYPNLFAVNDDFHRTEVIVNKGISNITQNGTDNIDIETFLQNESGEITEDPIKCDIKNNLTKTNGNNFEIFLDKKPSDRSNELYRLYLNNKIIQSAVNAKASSSANQDTGQKYQEEKNTNLDPRFRQKLRHKKMYECNGSCQRTEINLNEERKPPEGEKNDLTNYLQTISQEHPKNLKSEYLKELKKCIDNINSNQNIQPNENTFQANSEIYNSSQIPQILINDVRVIHPKNSQYENRNVTSKCVNQKDHPPYRSKEITLQSHIQNINKEILKNHSVSHPSINEATSSFDQIIHNQPPENVKQNQMIQQPLINIVTNNQSRKKEAVSSNNIDRPTNTALQMVSEKVPNKRRTTRNHIPPPPPLSPQVVDTSSNLQNYIGPYFHYIPHQIPVSIPTDNISRSHPTITYNQMTIPPNFSNGPYSRYNHIPNQIPIIPTSYHPNIPSRSLLPDTYNSINHLSNQIPSNGGINTPRSHLERLYNQIPISDPNNTSQPQLENYNHIHNQMTAPPPIYTNSNIPRSHLESSYHIPNQVVIIPSPNNILPQSQPQYLPNQLSIIPSVHPNFSVHRSHSQIPYHSVVNHVPNQMTSPPPTYPKPSSRSKKRSNTIHHRPSIVDPASSPSHNVVQKNRYDQPHNSTNQQITLNRTNIPPGIEIIPIYNNGTPNNQKSNEMNQSNIRNIPSQIIPHFRKKLTQMKKRNEHENDKNTTEISISEISKEVPLNSSQNASLEDVRNKSFLMDNILVTNAENVSENLTHNSVITHRSNIVNPPSCLSITRNQVSFPDQTSDLSITSTSDIPTIINQKSDLLENKRKLSQGRPSNLSITRTDVTNAQCSNAQKKSSFDNSCGALNLSKNKSENLIQIPQQSLQMNNINKNSIMSYDSNENDNNEVTSTSNNDQPINLVNNKLSFSRISQVEPMECFYEDISDDEDKITDREIEIAKLEPRDTRGKEIRINEMLRQEHTNGMPQRKFEIIRRKDGRFEIPGRGILIARSEMDNFARLFKEINTLGTPGRGVGLVRRENEVLKMCGNPDDVARKEMKRDLEKQVKTFGRMVPIVRRTYINELKEIDTYNIPEKIQERDILKIPGREFAIDLSKNIIDSTVIKPVSIPEQIGANKITKISNEESQPEIKGNKGKKEEEINERAIINEEIVKKKTNQKNLESKNEEKLNNEKEINRHKKENVLDIVEQSTTKIPDSNESSEINISFDVPLNEEYDFDDESYREPTNNEVFDLFVKNSDVTEIQSEILNKVDDKNPKEYSVDKKRKNSNPQIQPIKKMKTEENLNNFFNSLQKTGGDNKISGSSNLDNSLKRRIVENWRKDVRLNSVTIVEIGNENELNNDNNNNKKDIDKNIGRSEKCQENCGEIEHGNGKENGAGEEDENNELEGDEKVVDVLDNEDEVEDAEFEDEVPDNSKDEKQISEDEAPVDDETEEDIQKSDKYDEVQEDIQKHDKKEERTEDDEELENKSDEDQQQNEHNVKKNKHAPQRVHRRDHQRNSIKENIKPKIHRKRKFTESHLSKRAKRDKRSTKNEQNLDLIEIANILGDDFRVPRASRLKAEAKMSKYINILKKKKSHGRRMGHTIPTSDDEKDFIRIQTVAEIHCEPKHRLRLDSERSSISTASNFTNYELIPSDNTGLVVKLRKTSIRKNSPGGNVYKRLRYENGDNSVIKNNSVINSSLVMCRNNLVYNNERGECSKNNLERDEDDENIFDNSIYEDTSIFSDETDSESPNKLDQKDTTGSESDGSVFKKHKNNRKQIKYPVILQTNNFNKPKFIHTSPVKQKKKKMKDLKKEEIKRKVFLKKRFYLRNSNVSYKKYFSSKDSKISVILNKNRKRKKILSGDKKKKYWRDVGKKIKNSRSSSKTLHRKNKMITEKNKNLHNNGKDLLNYKQNSGKQTENLSLDLFNEDKNNQSETSTAPEELSNQLNHFSESDQLENHSDSTPTNSTQNLSPVKTNPVQIVFVDIQLIKPFTITLNPQREMLSQINTTEDSELILDSSLPNESILNLENEAPAVNIIDNLLLDLESRNLNDILLNQESSIEVEKSWLNNLENADVIFSNEEILSNNQTDASEAQESETTTSLVEINSSKEDEVQDTSVELITEFLEASTPILNNENITSMIENKSTLEEDEIPSNVQLIKNKSSADENKSFEEDKDSSAEDKSVFEEEKSSSKEDEISFEDKTESTNNLDESSITEKDMNENLNSDSVPKNNTTANGNIDFSDELMTILRMNVETILNSKPKLDPISRFTRSLKITNEENCEDLKDVTENTKENSDLTDESDNEQEIANSSEVTKDGEKDSECDTNVNEKEKSGELINNFSKESIVQNSTEESITQNNKIVDFIYENNSGGKKNVVSIDKYNNSTKESINQDNSSLRKQENDSTEKFNVDIQKSKGTEPDTLSKHAFSHFVDTVCDSVEDTIKEEIDTDKKNEDTTITLPSDHNIINNSMELEIYEITNKLKDALVKYHLKTQGETYEMRKKRFFNLLRNKFKNQNYIELLDVINELLQSLKNKFIEKLEDNPIIEVKNVISIDSNVLFNLPERKMEAVDRVTNYTAYYIKAILCNIFNLDKFNNGQQWKEENIESIKDVENLRLEYGNKSNESVIKKENESSQEENTSLISPSIIKEIPKISLKEDVSFSGGGESTVENLVLSEKDKTTTQKESILSLDTIQDSSFTFTSNSAFSIPHENTKNNLSVKPIQFIKNIKEKEIQKNSNVSIGQYILNNMRTESDISVDSLNMKITSLPFQTFHNQQLSRNEETDIEHEKNIKIVIDGIYNDDEISNDIELIEQPVGSKQEQIIVISDDENARDNVITISDEDD